jgi:hypothetical protein
MTHKVADDWFNDVDFVSIISTVKGIMTSDGTMSILLDFERVLDECDIYAFKNWLIGELVSGPDVRRYTVSCTFMWPYKLMPDPRAVKRLLAIGCEVKWTKKKIKVPIEVKNYDDFVQGTNYPKGVEREVWLVKITVPTDLMDDIKEGSIDLAGSTIDLEEIDNAYDEDLDKQGVDQDQSTAETDQTAMPAQEEPVPAA